MIEDIRTDCEVAKRSLEREGWRVGSGGGWEEWLGDFEWARAMGREEVERVEERVLGGGEGRL